MLPNNLQIHDIAQLLKQGNMTTRVALDDYGKGFSLNLGINPIFAIREIILKSYPSEGAAHVCCYMTQVQFSW